MQADAANQLLAELGVQLDPELLVLALTHRSFANEHGGVPTNERLEFLGDAVLGLAVADRLYQSHPGLPESALTQMRAEVVSQQPLAQVARQHGLGRYLLLGKGEASHGGADKDSILSDVVEALIGAVYVAHGHQVATDFANRLLGALLDTAGQRGHHADPKTRLSEYCAASGLPAPEYQMAAEGPAHALRFTAKVEANGFRGVGEGSSKKAAEKAAANAVLAQLDQPSGDAGAA